MDYRVDKAQDDNVIERIVFENKTGDLEGVQRNTCCIEMFDADKEITTFYISDIDHLIKALQKAKELWG